MDSDTQDTQDGRLADATGPSSAAPIEPVPVSPVPASVPSAALAKAEARIAKFLRRPPKRIAPEQVAKRRSNATRKAKRKGTLEKLAGRQGWKCAYCGQPMTNGLVDGKLHKMATIDHVLPISRGGGNAKFNLVAACHDCNRQKADMTLDEWRDASAIEARRAATLGAVHESAVAKPDAQPQSKDSTNG